MSKLDKVELQKINRFANDQLRTLWAFYVSELREILEVQKKHGEVLDIEAAFKNFIPFNTEDFKRLRGLP